MHCGGAPPPPRTDATFAGFPCPYSGVAAGADFSLAAAPTRELTPMPPLGFACPRPGMAAGADHSLLALGRHRRFPHGQGSSFPWQYTAMPLAHSKVTAQGQISVPAEVRRKFGIGPGSVREWDEDGDKVVVRAAAIEARRRVGRYTSKDVHRFLFATPPEPKTLAELKDGVRRDVKRRRASR